MNVDWSKAPEGATHWDPVDQNWLRQIGDVALNWISLRGWSSKGWQYPDDLSTMDRLIGRPIWSGGSLPPVGTVCEFAGGTPCPEDPFDKDLKEGAKVTIIAHFKCGDFTLAAFTFDPEKPDRGMVQVEQGNFGCFRPIRTQEQIAAEEKSKAISEIILAVGWPRNTTGSHEAAERIYDAGFRKQVQS